MEDNDRYSELFRQARENQDQWLEEAAKRFTRPWAGRRGIETIDRNAEVVLVRVPLARLSDELAKQATTSRQNVLASTIRILGSDLFAYQLTGHSWSLMTPLYTQSPAPPVIRPKGLLELSSQFKQPIIRFVVSDTGGRIGYDLIENGKLVEYFRFFEADEDKSSDATNYGIQPKRFDWNSSSVDRDADPDAPFGIAHFWSSRRQLTDKELQQGYRLVYRLFDEYEAYDPALDNSYWLGYPSKVEIGQQYRVQNPGIVLSLGGEYRGEQWHSREVRAIPELVRVDFFSFGK